ncbi:hypothetical protein FRACYDRAFT_196219 [Fragilariopsis cylindrus CCMP1102]|uniref:Helicase-associated domain-containing protein n=1 Tax=Fragilariopsis cylindrus CCMP1102 TaxID=635003 RepID=A0A1E7ES18_9STRA|nr:hypothetical protein FRACYDRAFT_196219 [Fragilariopsis cylindrus CCMP1102]|eukprot:OEU08637.1 hypothetical protein FRACYDRAFT_196219 [Fragilariopsis cylindrus CCMP1102]
MLIRSSRRRLPSNELHKSTKRTKRTTTYVESCNEQWHEMFRRLVVYKKKHKSILVPNKYAADLKLGKWVSTQRTNYKNDMIAENRVDLLNSVGFVWETYETLSWDEMFQRLVRYKKEHHTTVVPTKKNKADPRLGIWVSHQRTFYKNKKLPVERINCLDSIGFFWDPLDKQWMEMYQELLAYKIQHRSTNVPQCYMENPQLGKWVKSQRQVYNTTNRGSLSKKRLGLMNSINFVWSVR